MPESKSYAVVLGATSKGDQPTPVFAGRIALAVDLYQSGRVEKIIFTGAPGDPPQAQVGARQARLAGVPPDAILQETRSHNTLENLFFARQLLETLPKRPVLIISDPLHLKRAAFLAKRLNMEVQTVATPHSAFQSWGSRMKFLIRETFAYLYYRMLNGSGLLERKISHLSMGTTAPAP